jgi:two-component system, sensor histidine kinase PdtaS
MLFGFTTRPGTAFASRASGFEKGVAMAPRTASEFTLNLAMAVIASSDAPLLLLDDNVTVVAASKSFCRAFEIDQDDVAGRPLIELGAGEWNAAQLYSLLKATASGYAEVEGYEFDLVRQGQQERRLVLNAHKLEYEDGSNIRVLLAVSDVTDARTAEKLKEDLLKEKAVLLQELQHRVANSLQIIASVLMQSARKSQSVETKGHLNDAHQRVMSVAAVQKQLSASSVGQVELRPYFSALCDSIGASMIQDHNLLSLEVTTDDSVTSSEKSVSLGLIVTELVINALKHAFPSNRKGKIIVDYRTHGSGWALSVSDNGIGMSEYEGGAKAGLGTSIVLALARQLQAQIHVANAKPGTSVSMIHTQSAAEESGAKIIPLAKAV